MADGDADKFAGGQVVLLGDFAGFVPQIAHADLAQLGRHADTLPRCLYRSVTVFASDVKLGILWRDGAHCGMEGADGCPGGPADQVNHRLNRGAGGGGDDTPNNGCAIHGTCNGLLESDSEFASEGRRRGVKLVAGDDPEAVPFWSVFFMQWLWLRQGRALPTGDADFSLSARDERWLGNGVVSGG